MTGLVAAFAAGAVAAYLLTTPRLPSPRRWATLWRTQCRCGSVRRAPYRWVNGLRWHVHVRSRRHREWLASPAGLRWVNVDVEGMDR